MVVPPQYCRVFFDGSWLEPHCGSGWVCYGTDNPGPADDSWKLVAWMSFPAQGSSVTAAELEALAAAKAFVAVLLTSPLQAEHFSNHINAGTIDLQA